MLQHQWRTTDRQKHININFGARRNDRRCYYRRIRGYDSILKRRAAARQRTKLNDQSGSWFLIAWYRDRIHMRVGLKWNSQGRTHVTAKSFGGINNVGSLRKTIRLARAHEATHQRCDYWKHTTRYTQHRVTCTKRTGKETRNLMSHCFALYSLAPSPHKLNGPSSAFDAGCDANALTLTGCFDDCLLLAHVVGFYMLGKRLVAGYTLAVCKSESVRAMIGMID